MKKNYILLLLPIILSSCYSTKYSIDFKPVLTQVERRESGNKTNLDIKLDVPAYSDSNIFVMFVPTAKEIQFTLKNRSNNYIKIIWDEAIFIDFTGENSRVFHAGVRYLDRNSSIPSTSIMPDGNISDVVVPCNNISWQNDWHTNWIYPDTSVLLDDSLKAVTISKGLLNSDFKIVLPININNTTIYYKFNFKLKDGTIQSKNVYDGNKSSTVAYSVTMLGSLILILLLL